MRPLISTAIFWSAIFLSQESWAEMTKVRSWPAAIPVPSAELKKQYEYDPAAGAVSDKVVSVESTTTDAGVSTSVKVNYSGGMPVSGVNRWADAVLAYHGFSSFMATQYESLKIYTKSLNYSESGGWPSKSLKILLTNIAKDENSISEIALLTECVQIRSFNASVSFPLLPGRVYEYKCIASSASKLTSTRPEVSREPYEIGSEKYPSIIYYSDYLDTVLMIKFERQGGYTSYQVEFIGSDNKPHLLSYRDDKLVMP